MKPENVSHASWDDHEAPWNSLIRNLSEIYAQEILDKRPGLTQAALHGAIKRLSVALSEANAVIRSTLATLKRERNRAASIHTLPVELLCRIFRMSSHYAGLPSPRRKTRRPLPQNLMAISHTCSFWRTISLECPQLWSMLHIDCMPERLVTLFRERCGTQPLTLIFQPSEVNAANQSREDRFKDLLSSLTNNISCIRCYNLANPSSIVPLIDVPHTRWERLEELNLRCASVITAELPNLRILDLCRTPLSDRTASSLTRLTHLFLWGSETARIAAIMAVISASPVLRGMKLVTSSNPPRDADRWEFTNTPIIHHSLATIYLRLPAVTVGYILRSVTPVNLTELDIHFKRFGRATDLLDTAIRSIPDGVSFWDVPDARADITSTEVNISVRRYPQIEVRHKRWKAADPRRACHVTLHFIPGMSGRTMKAGGVVGNSALTRISRELLPKLFGSQSHPLSIDNAATSTPGTSRASPEHNVPHCAVAIPTVRFIWSKGDLEHLGPLHVLGHTTLGNYQRGDPLRDSERFVSLTRPSVQPSGKDSCVCAVLFTPLRARSQRHPGRTAPRQRRCASSLRRWRDHEGANRGRLAI